MSFVRHKDLADENDTVIVYLNYNLFYALVLKAGETFQTKYGALRHNDIIGRPYGSRISVKNGFVHFLWPTAELWTLSLPHRTQILYGRDISLTVFQLDLKPGCTVVESGTGSGSMTHSLARAVAPHGKVYTFDFHQVRAETAQKEFATHGLGDIVQCAHRDVCAEGFGLEGVADAVFLDLPHPWLAVDHAVKAIKSTGGRICSFSPCIEQVQRTCERLRELRCTDITTLECLERPYEVKTINVVKQNSRKLTCEYFVDADGKPLADETVPMQSTADEAEVEAMQQGDNDQEPEVPSTEVPPVADVAGNGDSEATPAKKRNGGRKRPQPESGESMLTAVPTAKIPGHTGYLTFATFLGR